MRDVNNMPFSLVKTGANNADQIIRVELPMNAEYLNEALQITHTHFEQAQQSTASRIITELIASERVRGVETTEQMLREGVQLTAFGRIKKCKLDEISKSMFMWITKSPGKIKYSEFKISQPTEDTSQAFILTNLSRSDLIDRLEKVSRSLKISLYIFGTIGFVLAGFCAYKYIREYIETKKRKEIMKKARLEREKARLERINRTRANATPVAAANAEADDQSTCVICLTNPRELILLDCGHVCLCAECVELMPAKNCPICRQVYRTYMPCYIP